MGEPLHVVDKELLTKFQNSWQCKEFTSDKRNLFGLLDLGQSREKIDRPSFPMERKNQPEQLFY